MNLDQIETKCFILALFIRDDNERFLLGSRAYEFIDSQLHFVANTYQNDVVEVQGNDGLMLAGQVRRGTAQPFDGYIGDSSVDRTTIEQYRRDFLKFFRKNHYYKVVYVFPDGSAIQRRNGFIVEAPEVKELYQLFPQYHISMNFEDINYYNYEEDSEGEEIYGESAALKIATLATGGLIWDTNSVTTLSGEGSNFPLVGTVNGNSIENVQIKGDTFQQTYTGKNLFNGQTEQGTFNSSGQKTPNANKYRNVSPIAVTANTTYAFSAVGITAWDLFTYDSSNNYLGYGYSGNGIYTFGNNVAYVNFAINAVNGASPADIQVEKNSSITAFEPYVGGIPAPNPDYPQAVNNVTGEQTVTISDGDGQSQVYTVDLDSIELCKIGTYQDYIYKDSGNWYVHKATNKLVFDGSDDEQWGYSNSNGNFYCNANLYSGGVLPANDTSLVPMYCDSLIARTYQQAWTNHQNYSVTARYDNNSNPRINNQDYTTLAGFKGWLSATPVTLYYPLITATDTQITNADLIAQLNALASATTYDDKTVFTVSSANQLAILSLSTTVVDGGGVVWNGYGAEWEEGTGGGPTTITVDSIDNVYPVWTVTGPAVNPQISVLNTNTILSYSGSVTASQELKIDMFNKTATLNGASVIGNVSGDWVYLGPGVNRVTYTTNNADAPDSTIWWQEIVG